GAHTRDHPVGELSIITSPRIANRTPTRQQIHAQEPLTPPASDTNVVGLRHPATDTASSHHPQPIEPAQIARSGLPVLAPQPHRPTLPPAVNRSTEPAIWVVAARCVFAGGV